MESLKNQVFASEFNDTFNGEQLRNLQKEKQLGWLYILGLQLEHMESSNDVLSRLKEIETYLTNVEQTDCRLPNWAIQPSMVTLVQPKFMEHPHKDVRLLVASYLKEIMRITSPTIACNDMALKKFLQLIVKNLEELHDDKDLAFDKRL